MYIAGYTETLLNGWKQDNNSAATRFLKSEMAGVIHLVSCPGRSSRGQVRLASAPGRVSVIEQSQ